MRRVLRLVLVLALAGCNQAVETQVDRNQNGGGDDGRSIVPLAGSVPAAPDTAAQITPASLGDWIVGEPIRHANLTLFPVSSRVPKTDDRFITLDAGLKAGTVEVMEVGAAEGPAGVRPPAATVTSVNPAAANASATGNLVLDGNAQNVNLNNASGGVEGNVNQLVVINRSDKPLYLMPGEIVVGGKQDRAIGGEYVIAPGAEPTKVDAFCVQHGRWGVYPVADLALVVKTANESAPFGGSTTVIGGSKADLNELAAKTSLGQFIGSVGNVSKQTRLAVQSAKNQGTVWMEVGAANAANGVVLNSEGYTGGTFSGNYLVGAATKPLEPYVDALLKPIAEHPNIVGVIAAINDKVEAADLFESTPLFNQLWPKLLKSYALDASLVARDGPTPTVAAAAGGAATVAASQSLRVSSRDDAVAFLAKIVSGEATSSETRGQIVTKTALRDGVISFSAHHQPRTVASAIPITDHGASAAAEAPATAGGPALHVGAFTR